MSGSLVLALVLSACSLFNAALDSSPAFDAGSQEMETPTAQIEELFTSQTAAPPEQTQESGQESGESGQAQRLLNSYRAKLTMKLSGLDQNSQTVDELTVILQESIRDQNASHFKLFSQSADATVQNFDLYQIEDQSYLLDQAALSDEEAACVLSSASNSGAESFLNFDSIAPENFFADVKTKELVQKDVLVNGVLTDHFSVNDASIIGTTFATKQADIWLAQEGGYVVRFYGEGQGETSSSVSGNSVDGTMTWEYDITDANQVADIGLPAACLQSAQNVFDVPTPENATNISRFDSVVSFLSPDSPASMVDFYQLRLPANGFKQVELSEFENVHILVYEKDALTYTIVISPGDGAGSAVFISAK
jgi:hypothetical protein